MRRIVLVAAWTAIVAACATVPEKGASPSVAIFMDFDDKPGDASLAVMKKEADALLKPSGVTLDWRLSRANGGNETFSDLVVVKFKGRCRVEAWSQPGTDFGTLGETLSLASTSVKEGHVLPFTEVECDQIRKALAYLRPDADQIDRQKALGLALGRVVAHELYHMLAHTTSHATAGLAKASQSLRDLVASREMSFQQRDFLAIRNNLH
ncbi:MAG: hypothetical protein C5B51_20920 [Terriglobia bacterium]|nr:MAG: hypothetical protein C5B51_20920 [Terriglobia bacterium]